MGLMDKFKNLFTDEEIIEEDDVDTVEIKEVKKENEVNKLPTFMREKIEKEEKKSMMKSSAEEIDGSESNDGETNSGFELPKLEEKSTFKFPIEFVDNDFVETRSRQSVHQKHQDIEKLDKIDSNRMEKKVKSEPKVADLYKDKKSEKPEGKPKFKATPIISPIYGILDKNYTSGDIEKTLGSNFEEKRPSKSVDFDSVRKKAYGGLAEEIKENLMCENCEYLREAKECRKEKEKIKTVEYSYEILDDDSSSNYKDITLDEATENYYDYGVEYEKESDTYNQGDVKISNFEVDKPKKEIPPVKSSINLLSTLKKSMGDEANISTKKEEKLELTDDLFNLIDSMYDERKENE